MVPLFEQVVSQLRQQMLPINLKDVRNEPGQISF